MGLRLIGKENWANHNDFSPKNEDEKRGALYRVSHVFIFQFAMADKNMQVRFGLKVVGEFQVVGI